MRVSLGIFLALLLSGCGDDGHGRFSYSSSPVEPTNGFPQVVRVIGRKFCTGVVVGPSAVLTAAHCVDAGARIDVRTDSASHSVVQSWALGDGQAASNDDVAVLLVASPFEEMASYSSVGTNASVGEEVTLVGFGCNTLQNRGGVGVKRWGTNVLSDIGERLEVRTPAESLKAFSIIGPRNRAGSCHGDSGGPLFLKDSVVGLVHSGAEDGDWHVSSYSNLTRPAIRKTLREISTKWNLEIRFQ